MNHSQPIARRTPSTFMVETATPVNSDQDQKNPAAVERQQQVARNENNDPNRCPVCNRAYQVSRANGHPVLVCLHDNIVMPVKD